MDPTPEVLAQMLTIKDVLDFVILPGDPGVSQTPRGALLEKLGATETEHPRNLGAMTVAEYTGYTSNLVINGNAPTPVQKTKVGMTGRICRIISECQLSQAGQRDADTAAATAAVAATAAQLAIAQSQVAVKSSQRTVKLSLTTQQGNDEEAPILPASILAQGFRNYFAIFKSRPPPDEEISIEHLSSIQYCLDHGLPPWADFCLLGPYGQRTMQKLKFMGLQIMPDGTFANQEFKGPPNHKTWDASYAVLRCGLIFLDTVELGALEAYRSKIRKYALLYEPSSLWHLLYQADYRMRHERMEHLRRMGQKAKDLDQSHPFDPANPPCRINLWVTKIENN